MINTIDDLKKFLTEYKHGNHREFETAKGKTIIEAKSKIGFFGVPNEEALKLCKEMGFELIDLDINYGNQPSGIVPKTTCVIIQNIVENALEFENQIVCVLCTTGKDKCMEGASTMELLREEGFSVFDFSNTNEIAIREPLISDSFGDVKSRVIRIMDLPHTPLTEEEKLEYKNKKIQKPRMIFCGVPPSDLTILDLLPPETAIYGWTRLVEEGTPCLFSREWELPKDIPILFYCQSFCHKTVIAKRLAEKRSDLYVEMHGTLSESMRAKIEAFITFKVYGKKIASDINVKIHQKDSE